jgi:hypothetical protein
MLTRRMLLILAGVLGLALAARPGEDEEQLQGDARCRPPGLTPHMVTGHARHAWKKEILLPGGLPLHVSYHFNRNALTRACLMEDAVLALTTSGHLLCFRRETLELERERIMQPAATALATVDGVPFVGRADGRVFRVDRALGLTEVARLSGRPAWMGPYHDPQRRRIGLLAAVVTPAGEEWAERPTLTRIGFGAVTDTTHLVENGLDPFVGRLSAFLPDRHGRLWLGRDKGEWGGWCGYVDLNKGTVTPVGEFEGQTREGAYGFVELPDGQVWAYGGMMHLGSSRASLARVDRGKFETLGTFEPGQNQGAGVPQQPPYPITHVLPDPVEGGLLVLSYSKLFRVDAQLRHWLYLGEVRAHYRWGRADAMGCYPSLRTALIDRGSIVCATALDGLLRVGSGKATSHVIPNQPPDSCLRQVLPAAGGTVLARWDERWGYSAGLWQQPSFDPPVPPPPAHSWYEHRLMLDEHRRLVVLSRDNSTPGTVVLTRWEDSKKEVLAREEGSVSAPGPSSAPPTARSGPQTTDRCGDW